MGAELKRFDALECGAMGRGSRAIKRWKNDRQRKKKEREKRQTAPAPAPRRGSS
jgi:hypothetical protein